MSRISATENNYQASIDLLKEHLGKTNVFVKGHVTYLLNLRSVASYNVAKSLESVKGSPQSCRVLLLTSVMQNVPQDLVLPYHQEVKVTRVHGSF